MTTPCSASVALFDLDGVLTTGDTMAELITARLLRQPLRLIVAIPLFLAALMARPHGRLRPALNRGLVLLALRGLTDHDYSALAAQFGRELGARPRFRRDRAVREAAEAATRMRTVVVTASEHMLARAYLDAVGLSGCELLASSRSPGGGRVRLAQHNIGAAKVAAVRAAGIDPSECSLHTDSSSDLPLAEAVATVTLVNPSARTIRVIRDRVPQLEIVRW